MSGIVDKITAALDAADKRLSAVPTRYISGCVDRMASRAEHDLIVSVVNREARQVRHARDVLARHRRHGDECDTSECLSHEKCAGCWGSWPCTEFESLVAVWCPEDAS